MRYNQLIDCVQSAGGEVSYIGESRCGYPIPMVSKGKSGKGGVLIVGGVHAREYITTYLLTKLIADYSGDYPVDVVPCLNIDGMLLAEYGLNELALRSRDRLRLLKLNGGSTDFSSWKANILGVDINVNFDAGWGEGESNVTYPASANYIGPCPESEPETRAICELLRNKDKDYALAVAYHSRGEEVYWGFRSDKRFRKEAQAIAVYLGYRLLPTPTSAGGLKDYWTLYSGRLGLTIEIGSMRYGHPYPLSELAALEARHKDVIEQYALVAREVWTRR